MVNVEGIEKLRQPGKAGSRLLKLATDVVNGDKLQDNLHENEKKYFRTFKIRAVRMNDSIATSGSLDETALNIATDLK